MMMFWMKCWLKEAVDCSIQQLHNVGIDISVIAEPDDLEFNGNVLNVNNDIDLLINSRCLLHLLGGEWINLSIIAISNWSTSEM